MMRAVLLAKASVTWTRLLYVLVVTFTFSLIFVARKMTEFPWLDMLHETSYAASARIVDNGWIPYVCAVVISVSVPVVVALRCSGVVSKLVIRLLSVVVMLVVSLFYVVMVFGVVGLVGSWRNYSFSSRLDATELVVAHEFNSLYCESQTEFFCDRAALSELLQVNFGQVVLANSSKKQSDEVVASCLAHYGLNVTQELPAWAKVCAYCVASEDTEHFKGFLNWISDECRPKNQTLSWCTGSQADADSARATIGSPYDVCRTPFLDYTHYWTRTLGGLIMGNVICLLGILASSLYPLIPRKPTQPVEVVPITEVPLTPTYEYVEVVKGSDISSLRSASITSAESDESDIQSGTSTLSSLSWYMDD
ncbi:hypothetical protein Poli38472_005871 [Pythium oligandrum]|uniref:Uncharacterized protein n=1 Tax=Pythium oligandrum TaxID=41045 RepID=A0A8K1CT23_PYTOL|nr:hypothetical protein Poli38472_005871 [Pythium oligandrum]|eukprot:TMW68403.1 hypothetical protein Poli38472_005871 [Pythium oligandrum]